MAQPCRLRLGSDSVEVDEVERTPQSGLTASTGGWRWDANAEARTRSNLEAGGERRPIITIKRGFAWGRASRRCCG